MELIGIVGAGRIGIGIAHLAASKACSVKLYDIEHEQSLAAVESINSNLDSMIKEGKMEDAEALKISHRIKCIRTLDELSDSDMIIECVPENRAIKKEVFVALDEVCKGGVVLATNAASISITEIAGVTGRPESVIGLHFLVPVLESGIVEIISGVSTADETLEYTKMIVKKFGKKYIKSKDFPGFIINRMIIPFINEAAYLLMEDNGSVESIDRAMVHGMGFDKGPLELADIMGLDNVLTIMSMMHEYFGDSKYRPCPLLRQYVAAGWLGQSTGRGFYRYE